MTARRKKAAVLGEYLIDHKRPLPASVVGRGKDEMTFGEVVDTYLAIDTRYGIGSAGVAVEMNPVVFEEPLMAALDEQGEVEL